ncbi:AAA domain-containing protein [Candidatus Poribacteria bacterium]|nr:AAA domain-containing protein [Candidatus Poribacteria bacterium]MYB63881.1 AAA domain-containing protein [Candidatus Poribacteria bacterium]MYF54627.1 AAA domain-containing protein [Candidatus Poribacteria bacterium]
MATDRKLPTQEEIEKDFQEFFQKKYGDGVNVRLGYVGGQQATSEQTEAEIPEPQKTFDLKFDLKPKDIKEYLDRYVIKQDEAKKALAIAVCDHYNHVRECHENPDATDTDYSKQNIVMLGPTGVGKTYLIRHIAKLIGVPFVKADATRFSETGYVGANVDDLIRELVAQAEDNLELAQYGIIYLDEADKIATPPNIIGRDVSGRGVQIGLLKLMEETEVDLSGGHDVASQMRAVMEFQKRGKVDKQVINTRHILFIISGAFTGMEDIIKKRMHQSRIGFSVEVTSQKDAAAEYFAHVTPKDFIDFGFEPEFIGRLPVHVVCTELEVDDLYHILKHSEGSIIRQYENAFRAYGINVLFSDNGLQRIAEKAIEQKTGARALMTVCEKILRNYKFELPSTGVVEFVVTADVVDTPDDELKKIMSDPEYNRTSVMKEQIRRYEGKFHADHDLKIEFDDDAVKAICQSAIKQELSIQQMCDEILKSYQHGLNLIKQNTGQTAFSLPKQVVDNPDPILEKWIRDSYHTKDEAKE